MCICWWMNCVNIRILGAMIKKYIYIYIYMLYVRSLSSLIKFTQNHLHSFVGTTGNNCPAEEVISQLEWTYMLFCKKAVEMEISNTSQIQLLAFLSLQDSNFKQVKISIFQFLSEHNLGHLTLCKLYNWNIQTHEELIIRVQLHMLILTDISSCVYSSQWLYSTCFGWQFHPSSGVQCCIWPLR